MCFRCKLVQCQYSVVIICLYDDTSQRINNFCYKALINIFSVFAYNFERLLFCLWQMFMTALIYFYDLPTCTLKPIQAGFIFFSVLPWDFHIKHGYMRYKSNIQYKRRKCTTRRKLEKRHWLRFFLRSIHNCKSERQNNLNRSGVPNIELMYIVLDKIKLENWNTNVN